MSISDVACRNAKPKNKKYRLSDGDGLGLRVDPTGAKYWIMRYQWRGKEKNLSLGVYPVVSLSAARKQKDEIRRLLKEGTDPAVVRAAQKFRKSSNEDDSFEAIGRDWIKDKKIELSPRYAKLIENRLEDDIFPEIGRLRCKDITHPMLLAVLKKVQARGALETAHRLRQYCSMIFRHAIFSGMADRDPAADLRGGALPSPKKSHFSAIDPADLPGLLLKMADNSISVGVQTRMAMRLLMLTFVRTRELVEAPWTEFDMEAARWIIPAARMKMDRDHIVPLSHQAIEILKVLKKVGKGDYVFPGYHSWQKPMSNMAILMGLKRMGYKGKMTGHGFRALAMTTLREVLGYPKDLIDIQLAHAKGKVDSAYDRAKFLKERAEMMQSWADYIDKTEKFARENLDRS